MKKALARAAFAILKRSGAKLWWDTKDVPGLFDPSISGRVVFRFDTMRMEAVATELKIQGANSFNFVHTCPPDCE